MDWVVMTRILLGCAGRMKIIEMPGLAIIHGAHEEAGSGQSPKMKILHHYHIWGNAPRV